MWAAMNNTMSDRTDFSLKRLRDPMCCLAESVLVRRECTLFGSKCPAIAIPQDKRAIASSNPICYST